jgi:2-polyprenyl-3-methyl-5-hydroxy-6-metoxy-1,4-benzoquinol methylase
MNDAYGPCEICGTSSWSQIYAGNARDGVFGQSRPDTTVMRCGGCGVDRLDESACPDESFYETPAYRAKLQEELTAAGHFAVADELQVFTHQAIWPWSVRGRVVADIGAAGGSLLDSFAGMASRCVAIEPCTVYHASLKDRGYAVYPYAEDAGRDLAGTVDLAFSIQVIEHVRNPREFLAAILPLLSPEGRLVVSTPNREDILLKLLPRDFAAFFYRVVHRWYFDANALSRCAQMAGFDVIDTRFVHRYGMANALTWLRDRRPSGRARIDAIAPLADDQWASYLSLTGQSDCLYLVLGRRDASR